MYLYLQKSDYEAFEKDRQLTALDYRTKKRKGLSYIEREHTIRGLEELFDMDDSQRTTTSRSDHSRRFLEEQRRQRDADIFPNTTMLREIACRSSRVARQRSAILGEADALAGYVSSSRSLQRQAAGVMHSLSRKLQGWEFNYYLIDSTLANLHALNFPPSAQQAPIQNTESIYHRTGKQIFLYTHDCNKFPNKNPTFSF